MGWIILIFLFFLGFTGDGLFGGSNGELSQVNRDILTTSATTQSKVDQARYDALLTAKDTAYQQAQCCCEIQKEGQANTQLILDKLCTMQIDALHTQNQALRDTNQSYMLELNNEKLANSIVNQIRPTPVPSYNTCSPYAATSVCNNACPFLM